VKKKILLVNEDPAVRRMLFRVLTGENYLVTSEAGMQSLRPALVADVDLVVLDIDVGDQHGWRQVQTLARERTALPVIVLSDRPDLLAKPAYISAVLEKPLDVPRLLRTIEELIVDRAGVQAR
jgi:DNA-binding response OmpR family regulator